MALSPQDLVLTADELDKAKQLEDVLDTALKRDFVPGTAISEMEILFKASERVAAEVIRRYKAAGWSHVERLSTGAFRFTL